MSLISRLKAVVAGDEYLDDDFDELDYPLEDELNDSDLYSIKKDENPRDFILCTNANDYQKLKDGPYSVVLQNSMKKNNNGSLSWAAIKHGIRYINIETRLGWLSQQRKMLQFVEKRLKK